MYFHVWNLVKLMPYKKKIVLGTAVVSGLTVGGILAYRKFKKNIIIGLVIALPLWAMLIYFYFL